MNHAQGVRGVHVNFSGIREQYRALKPGIDEAVQSVMSRGTYIGGPEVERFERWFAGHCGVREAVSVSSGTTALELALRALGIGPGDEVITSAFGFVATAAAIAWTGANPRFADVLEASGNLDPGQLRVAVTSRTRAVVPVHLYGQTADMDQLQAALGNRSIPIIEDAAHAHGACFQGCRAGSIGVAGCFSFYPSKNLGAFGDGGMVTTNDRDIARAVRILRDQGRTSKYEHAVFGYTGRLDAIQAAVLNVKADSLDAWNANRRRTARLYRQLLSSHVQCFEDPRNEGVYHVFAIRVPMRDKFRAHLESRGVETAIHYPVPLHLQPASAQLGYMRGDFPVSERLAREVVSLPMHPFLEPQAVAYVADVVRGFLP